MSYSLKQSNQISLNSPIVQVTANTFKLPTAPSLNNSNTEFLTRNTGTGNLERTTTVPNLYTTNGTLTGNRTVSTGVNDNLTFQGIFGMFTVSGWAGGVNLNTIPGSGPINITAGVNLTLDANLGTMNIAATTPTTNISNAGNILQLRGSTINMNNIPISTISSGTPSPQFVQVGPASRTLTADTIPGVYGSNRVFCLATNVLTSSIPTDILGVGTGINFSTNGFGLFQTGTYGFIYTNTGTAPVSKSIPKRFLFMASGFIESAVAQLYTAAIAVNGVNVIGSTTYINLTAPGITQFSLFPLIIGLNVGDTVTIAFGRNTTDTSIRFECGMSIVQAATFAVL